MIIAIDGPTASGKGTISRRLAEIYGLPRLDTGALYRAVGLALLDAAMDPADVDAATRAADALDVAAIDEDRIRTAEAGRAASIVAAIPAVRAALLGLQQAFARQPGGAVLDGRDIATMVCPEAHAKLFVTADLPVRAARRYNELKARGETITLEALTRQIAERDLRDSSRADAPLIQAADAFLLDTTSLSIEEAVEAARQWIDRRRDGPSGPNAPLR